MVHHVLRIASLAFGLLASSLLGGVLFAAIPLVQNGVLDLRSHDWKAAPMVMLSGNWEFWAGQFVSLDQVSISQGKNCAVPGSWATAQQDGAEHGLGTYHVRLLLGEDAPSDLGLCMEEFLSAYQLFFDAKPVGGRGLPRSSRSTTQPGTGPACYPLPQGNREVDVFVQGANFHHRKGGMMQAPVLARMDTLQQKQLARAILGGILLGLLVMSSIYQFMRYLSRRNEWINLIHGLWTLSAALHFLCLHERWLYGLLGNWALGYKLELISLFCTLALAFLFLRGFCGQIVPKWIFQVLLAGMAIQALFVLVTPVHLAAEVDKLIPYQAPFLALAFLSIMGFAAIRKVEGSIPMLLGSVLFSVSVAFQGFLFEVHVGGLLPFHYLFSAFVLSFSWLLARRGAHMDIRLVQLGLDLEKSNSALAAHNQNLEAEVKERTEELMEAEKRTYSMMLDQRQRDLEALNANNQMKMQLRRQLVLDLQEILKAGPEQQAQLRSLIAGLQGQIATEERLGVLQDDLETVNAEFYARLAARFPLLSKSEKELCALLKLNLSSKDIAAVRQGSINTVNVARHRLKKKLELGADEDLETFIQNF